MCDTREAPEIPVPRGWSATAKSAALHVFSLAQWAMTHARGCAADNANQRVRLKAELDRAQEEVALLREEVRIKDARMAQIDAHRRPHYPPTARMAILELKAARAWSLEQTAAVFLVTAATVASWLKRIDEQGPAALVQTPQPVNRFPQFVRYAVQRLKALCPAMGKVKIAETLARGGLHLGVTTVGRILKEQPPPAAAPPDGPSDDSPAGPAATEKKRVVTAKYPNHVWHVDLTTAPTSVGFWCSWLPFALPQCWPFCWWVALGVDHFSRRAMGFAVFKSQPTSEGVRAFLGRAMHQAQAVPKYLICDKGGQFWNDAFKGWCQRKGIQPRFGAIGQHGSIAVIERFIRTLKEGCTRLLTVPLRREPFLNELQLFREWFNEYRPHMSLGGKTPNEVYSDRFPANRKPRFEPRDRWPRGSPCAKPWALVKGTPGARIELRVEFHAGRKHLPIATVQRAA